MISTGVALASRGELRFNLIGFFTQAAAVAVRALLVISHFRFIIAHAAVLVRSFTSGDDPDPTTRIEDGPSGFITLLCTSMRNHQRRCLTVYRGFGAVL